MEDQLMSEVNNAIQFLEGDGVIVYPTDTIWGIGCDATNAGAVERIYKIKNRSESKSLITLVDSIEMLEQYVFSVPENIKSYLGSVKRPTTVIYQHKSGLAANAIASDGSVAIRIVNNKFCSLLIKTLGKPIISTSANFSNQPSPQGFDEIDDMLLKQVDYIVNLPAAESKSSASQIIKFNDLGEIQVLRK